MEQAGKSALVLLKKAFNAIPPDGRQIVCELVIAPASLSRNRIKTQIKIFVLNFAVDKAAQPE